VAAFLAATATKVAIYVLLRFYYSVFGQPQVFGPLPTAQLLLLLALAGMFAASTMAIFQTDLKRLFAYSSVGQIGYIVLGMSFDSVSGLTAAIAHLFNHGVTKGAIFLLLGGVALRMGGCSLVRVQGLARVMPLTSFGIVLCGLSLIGVPGTAGFVSKWYLLLAALEKGQWWLVFLILGSSLLAVAYVWRFVENAYFKPLRADCTGRTEAPLSMLLPAGLLVAAVIYFGLDTLVHGGLGRRGRQRAAGGRALMAAQTWMLAALAVPALGALLIALAGRAPALRETITGITAVLLLLCVVQLLPAVRAGGQPELTLWTLLPGLDLRLRLEPLGMLFALIASGLWIVNSLYSVGYMRANREGSRRASSSALRWPCPPPWASRWPATCSRCSCSTKR
jgi:formate hydrogenlyase subunit 3/multisubunit Na+/H+ antiporter MnhD subunit